MLAARGARETEGDGTAPVADADAAGALRRRAVGITLLSLVAAAVLTAAPWLLVRGG